MSDLSDLGKLVKKHNPEYREFEDDEIVGMMWVKDHPEDFPSEALAVLEKEKPKTPSYLQRQLSMVDEKSDPNRGIFGTFFGRKNLEGKNKNLEEANRYRYNVRQSLEIQHDIASMPERYAMAAEQAEAEHNLYLMQNQQAQDLTQRSLAMGVDTETYLELKKKILMDEQDLHRRWQEIEQDLKAGFIYQMRANEHLSLLTRTISGLYQEVLLAGDDRTRNLLEEHITFMEQQYRGQRTRLLQASNDQDAQGSDEDTERLRDPR